MTKKILLVIASVLAIIALLIWYFYFATITNSNLSHYAKKRVGYISSSDVMPDLDTLPNYNDILYQYRQKRLLFFSSDTLLLAVTYDDETYLAQKENIEEKYFLDHAIANGEKFSIPEYEFSINSFTFKVLGNEDGSNEYEYPKHFGMIATSDEKNTMAYLYFYDEDLDFISENKTQESMKDFIKKYYRYEW